MSSTKKKIIVIIGIIVGIFIVIPMLFLGYNYYTNNMRETWYSGTPSILQQKQNWISTSQPCHSLGNKIKFVRYEVHTQNHYGIDPIQQDYNGSGKRISSGCASSAFACINPHYRYLSDTPWNVTYELTSGGTGNPSNPKSSNGSLYYELHNTIGRDFGGTWIIRIVGHRFKLWSYNQENGKITKKFMGTYTQEE